MNIIRYECESEQYESQSIAYRTVFGQLYVQDIPTFAEAKSRLISRQDHEVLERLFSTLTSLSISADLKDIDEVIAFFKTNSPLITHLNRALKANRYSSCANYVEFEDRYLFPLLSTYCTYGYVAQVNYLLQKKCAVNRLMNNGRYLIHQAIEHKQIEVLRLLINEKHIDLACRNRNHETPMDLTLRLLKTNQNKSERAQLLLIIALLAQKNAPINQSIEDLFCDLHRQAIGLHVTEAARLFSDLKNQLYASSSSARFFEQPSENLGKRKAVSDEEINKRMKT